MLDRALALARARPFEGRCNFAAIACDKAGNVLAVGYNSYCKTHPAQHRAAARAKLPGRDFLHAEIAALVKARGEVYSLSVARITKDGKPALAKPCPICYLALREAGVKKVEWTI